MPYAEATAARAAGSGITSSTGGALVMSMEVPAASHRAILPSMEAMHETPDGSVTSRETRHIVHMVYTEHLHLPQTCAPTLRQEFIEAEAAKISYQVA